MDASDSELSTAIFWFFVSITGAIATGFIAHKKGISVFWFVFMCLFCWPAGLVISLVVPTNKKRLEDRTLRSGTSKRCPHCAEIIRAEAHICPHCRGIV
jgi:hypothetical protein